MRRSSRRTVVCAVGTRPEAIKMAPVIRALRSSPWARCRVVSTGQHRELLAPILGSFGIEPDIQLDAMRPGQPVPELTARLVGSMRGVLAAERPELVLAQGDTASVLATAMASHLQGRAFGHVEAGLRTGNLGNPFPEEANRVVVSHLATLHFAPTATARRNLLREGIADDAIHVTGNTVIDALLEVARREHPPESVGPDDGRALVLVTVHRRDNLGEPLRNICRAVRRLHDALPGAAFLWPVHPNPAIRPVVHTLMAGLPRVRLCRPLSYPDFVAAMMRSRVILTDSGGIQEEAPALGKPVVVLRAESERPEAVSCGAAVLVGDDVDRIEAETRRHLAGAASPQPAAPASSPFGDGRASGRIVAVLEDHLGIDRRLRAAG
jgi:UDP-N-acetylglucosamine 2-epimerase (non-hydrolysing)